MKRKIIIGSVAAVGLLLIVFMVWYNSLVQMKPVTPHEINASGTGMQLLIATQGSDYKDALVAKVEKQARQDPQTRIRVIDVSMLAEVNRAEWDAILMLQAWEKWNPHPAVKAFVDKGFDPETMLLVTTSDSQTSSLDGIDAITGASNVSRVDADALKILTWLDAVPVMDR